MSNVVKFRPFKFPHVVETQFFTSTSKLNQEFADQDLLKSGLVVDDVHAYYPPLMRLKEGALAGYIIPYFNLDGQPITDSTDNLIMYRTRMKYPEFSKEQRYTQPSAEQLLKNDLPPFLPYINPLTIELEGDTLVCCEGEKKTASVLKYLRMPAFGIGGCQMWRDPNGSGSIHPWIRDLLRKKGINKVLIVPDADLYRYDICNAYGTFAHVLANEGFQVDIVNPPGKIDDLIVSWGHEALANFAALPKVNREGLVQSPASLAKRYNLAFKQDDKGRITVFQHTSNIMKLMEEHNAFPKIWRNLDNNRIMVGEEAAVPDLTEMEVANYFQHNLGFDKVTSRLIYSTVQALGKRNARSPFLEYVRGQSWDGKPRINTWLEDYWGVPGSPYLQEVSAKWLISACARLDKPGTKIDWMLIVVGPQGVGKTSMPSIVFNGMNLTLYGEHNDKDLHMLLHSALCVGFDELDSFGKRESSNLKAMITRNEDAFRPPYGASVEIFPRRFTLYGCGNRYEFLQHDPSGYRRYAIVEVDKLLDFAGLESARDQLWAEAWYRYQQGGVNYWEVTGASKEAEQYVIANPLEEMIKALVDRWSKQRPEAYIYRSNPNKLYFTISDIQVGLNMEPTRGNTTQNREMGAILHSLYGKSKNTTGPKGQQKYYIVEL